MIILLVKMSVVIADNNFASTDAATMDVTIIVNVCW